jgi:hypothetical protein
MDFIIFVVGFVVSMSVVYGIFAQVPLEMVARDSSPADRE